MIIQKNRLGKKQPNELTRVFLKKNLSSDIIIRKSYTTNKKVYLVEMFYMPYIYLYRRV
jgi:hypothetical protein